MLERCEDRATPALLTDSLADLTSLPTQVSEPPLVAVERGSLDTAQPLAAQQAVSPKAMVDFPPAGMLGTLTIEIKTASGATSKYGPIKLETQSGKSTRDLVIDELRELGWVVEPMGDTGIKITGKKNPDGTTDPIAEIKVTSVGDLTPQPSVTVSGGVVNTSPPRTE